LANDITASSMLCGGALAGAGLTVLPASTAGVATEGVVADVVPAPVAGRPAGGSAVDAPPLASGIAGCAGFWVKPNSRRADNIASYSTFRRAWPWPSQLELDGATGSLAAVGTGATGVDVDGALTMLKNVSETEEMDMKYSKLMTAA
jgi:hypothetical protein